MAATYTLIGEPKGRTKITTNIPRYPQKIQHFPGVTVYTPSNILNQSHVVIMFQSGAGVEVLLHPHPPSNPTITSTSTPNPTPTQVLENKHYMAARVFLPWEFINQTRGLFGNWTFDPKDDFTAPNGETLGIHFL